MVPLILHRRTPTLTRAIFFVDLVRFITDPEHKHMTLEELMVVSAPQCDVSNETNRVLIEFTPTVPHCGMSTVIGALGSVRLRRD